MTQRRDWRTWAGLGARMLLGGVWLVAGLLKLPDPDASVRAVRAYRLLPEVMVSALGYGLPVLEVTVGILLIVGLGTRLAAAASAWLLLMFMTGIASAWARGLQIECGCFGGGGFAADATQQYPWEILRDVGLFAASALLVGRPRTPYALDNGRTRTVPAAGVALALVVLVGAGGLVQSTRSAEAGGTDALVVPRGVVAGYAVPRGDASAPVTLTIYEDFQCPACRALETFLGPSIDRYVRRGVVRVEYHPIAFLDEASTTDYSSRSLGAAACVLDESGRDAFVRMHGLLFANQPPEGSAGLSDSQLAQLAVQSGAKRSEVTRCLQVERFAGWVDAATERSSREGVNATPTVLVNGQQLRFSSSENPKQTLRRAVNAAS